MRLGMAGIVGCQAAARRLTYTVPAGSFKAWRVTTTDNLSFRQIRWSVPHQLGMFAKRLSERPAGHPQGAGMRFYEMTQVPANQ